jgi:hypothetical protein
VAANYFAIVQGIQKKDVRRMKIGILTHHFSYNFGANLQLLSTFSYLANRGHHPIVINWIPKKSEERTDRRTTGSAQAAVHESFIADHLSVSPLCETSEDIGDLIQKEQIEAVIIGSDAVVKIIPRYDRFYLTRKFPFFGAKRESIYVVPNPFWGDFLEFVDRKLPCAMMSVASENPLYRLMSTQERLAASNCLKRLCHVSVRDSWTKEMMAWISRGNCDPVITPDPVFAFNNNVPSALIDDAVVQRLNLPDKYILVSFKKKYCLPQTDKWVAEFSNLAESMGCTCVAFPYPEGINSFSLKNRVELPLDPLDWYAIIKHASGYIGNNMHPIIACIHNCVPFYSIDNYGYMILRTMRITRSSKIYDLLRQIGMLDQTSHVRGRCPVLKKPCDVLDRLVHFDKTKCDEARSIMHQRYRQMMGDIEIAITR